MGRGIVSAGLHRTERTKLETRATDPSNPAAGEVWIRVDLDSGTDKLAEFRHYNGSNTTGVDIVAIGTTGTDPEEFLRTQTPNGKATIPAITPPRNAALPGVRVSHNGTVYALGVRAIPNSGIEQIGWTADGREESGFSQLGFVGGGEQSSGLTAIGFN